MAGNLIEKINEDLVSALRAKDEITLSTLRFLISKFTNARIAKGEELTGEEVLAEISKDAKRHRESIEAFEKGGRVDLVDKEKAQLAVLEKYLPQQLAAGDIEKIVDEAINKVGAKTSADLGKVMQEVMTNYKGQIDGSRLSALVGQKLARE